MKWFKKYVLVLSYICRSQGITSTSLTLKAAIYHSIWLKNSTVNDDNIYRCKSLLYVQDNCSDKFAVNNHIFEIFLTPPPPP